MARAKKNVHSAVKYRIRGYDLNWEEVPDLWPEVVTSTAAMSILSQFFSGVEFDRSEDCIILGMWHNVAFLSVEVHDV